MTKPINTLTRRQFLKGAAYTSALSVGALSGLAFAGSPTITLLNQSNRPIVLDAAQPVSLEKAHGWVVVKLNTTLKQGSDEVANKQGIRLAAGQQRSFAVDAELAPALKEKGGHIVITNEHSALDSMVPMATYDVVVV